VIGVRGEEACEITSAASDLEYASIAPALKQLE
jgi:hypothetical protein